MGFLWVVHCHQCLYSSLTSASYLHKHLTATLEMTNGLLVSCSLSVSVLFSLLLLPTQAPHTHSYTRNGLSFTVWILQPLSLTVCQNYYHWRELPQVLSRQKFCHDKQTKPVFCCNKSKHVVTTLSSWQNCVCCNRIVLLWQTYVCHDKSFVATSILLSWQTHVCRVTNMFVVTKVLLQHKWYLWQPLPLIDYRHLAEMVFFHGVYSPVSLTFTQTPHVYVDLEMDSCFTVSCVLNWCKRFWIWMDDSSWGDPNWLKGQLKSKS